MIFTCANCGQTFNDDIWAYNAHLLSCAGIPTHGVSGLVGVLIRNAVLGYVFTTFAFTMIVSACPEQVDPDTLVSVFGTLATISAQASRIVGGFSAMANPEDVNRQPIERVTRFLNSFATIAGGFCEVVQVFGRTTDELLSHQEDPHPDPGDES